MGGGARHGPLRNLSGTGSRGSSPHEWLLRRAARRIIDREVPRMALLDGKTGIIFGVANKRSIAWAIAQALAREGMRLAFTYQGERLKETVEALTSTMPDAILLPC